MRPEIEFLLGCFILSLVLTYAWWVRLRIWMFRQDLFEIRDCLWDVMRERGALDDRAYQDLRAVINSLIRLAPFLSLLTVIRLVSDREKFAPLLARNKSIPELEQARQEVILRVMRYLLFEGLGGLALVCIAAIYGLVSALKKAVSKRIEWLIDSKVFQTLDDHLSLKNKGQLAEA